MQLDGVGASIADINGRYAFDESSGTGVTVYLIDTVRLSFPAANSLADECFRVLIRTMWYGSHSQYDSDNVLMFLQEFSRIKQSWQWAGPDYTRTREGAYPDGVPGDLVMGNDEPAHGTKMCKALFGVLPTLSTPPSIHLHMERLTPDCDSG